MAIDIIDTVGNQIQVIDDGTTIADILHALAWVEKERARHRGKHRVKKSTGNPVGRPRKSPPVAEDKPVRGRGRPKKNPVIDPPVEI
jgi:hypothetical protein